MSKTMDLSKKITPDVRVRPPSLTSPVRAIKVTSMMTDPYLMELDSSAHMAQTMISVRRRHEARRARLVAPDMVWNDMARALSSVLTAVATKSTIQMSKKGSRLQR